MRHINFFLGAQNGVFWVGAKKFMLKKFMCFFGPLSLISAVASRLRLSLLVGFGGIEAVDTEFPYPVPIVDRGAIAVPLFANPISDS